jgi:ubiquinone/menaquinone biosynthesis C-methylase UbiE
MCAVACGFSGAFRMAVKEGDARKLPFADGTFDVVSNFVVHELKSRADRQQMMCEVARALKPGGRVALVDSSSRTSVSRT